MKKLNLSLEELKVQSFETNNTKKRRGTVNGEATGPGQFSCAATDCGENTCEGNSCDGTCIGEETCDDKFCGGGTGTTPLSCIVGPNTGCA